jgi:hypothetical protein
MAKTAAPGNSSTPSRRHSTVPVSEQNPVSDASALQTLHKFSAVQIKAVFLGGNLQTGGNALFLFCLVGEL